MRARPRRFLSWFNHLQLPAPLVEAPRPYPEFSRQLTDIFTSLHACDSHSLKFPGIPFPLHLWFLSRKLCPFLCVSSRVHSTRTSRHRGPIGPRDLPELGVVMARESTRPVQPRVVRSLWEALG